jgi:hypothetical protein
MLNKKAQVGESLTWMIATVIIIVILIIFVYASSILAVKNKGVEIKTKYSKIRVNEDWIKAKNEMGFSRSSDKDNRAFIENWIKEVEEKNG